MGILNKESVKHKVRQLLEKHPCLRDNDHRLAANIWKTEVPYREMSATDLLTSFAQGNLSHFESIRRIRQKLQEENPSLRGERYQQRQQDLQLEVKNKLKTFNHL